MPTKKTFYIAIDASGSMRGGRADAVNVAMHDVVNEVLVNARKNKDSEIEVRVAVLTFKGDNTIDWIIPKVNIDLMEENWNPMSQDYFYGETPTGAAIEAIIEDFEKGNYGEREKDAIPPVILLISDGMPNGDNPTYEEVLERVERDNPKFSSNFRNSTRIAIGVNVDDSGRESLKKFGRLTRSMEGFQSYYDCSDLKLDELVEIIKAVTAGATH